MSRAGASSKRAKPLSTHDIARAAALKRMREQAGITQEDLAARLNVSQGTLSDWERVRKPIPQDRFEALIRLAQELQPSPQPPETPAADWQQDAVPEDAPLEDFRVNASQPGEVAAEIGDALSNLLAGANLELVRDVQMFYAFGGQTFSRFVSPAGGQVVQKWSPQLAASLVQAAEVNAFVRRIVELMQIGPVSTCVILHVTVMVEVIDAMRVEARERAEHRARMEAAATQRPAEPVAGPITGPIAA